MKLYLREAQKQIAKAPSDEERLSLLLARSIEFYRNHPKIARTWAEEARKLARKQKNRLDEARAILRLGCASFQLCEYQRTVKELQQALKIFDAVASQSQSKGSALLLLGMAKSEMGQLREAMEHYEDALKLCGDNPIKRAEVLIEMGNTAMAMADYPSALKHYYTALEYLEQEDEILHRATILMNIGRVYQAVEDLEKADKFLERAFLLSTQTNDLSSLAEILHNRGVVMQLKNQPKAAKRFFTAALEADSNISPSVSKVYVSESLGRLELELGKNNVAQSHFQEAQRLAKALGLTRVLCSSLIGSGKADHNIGRLDESATTLEEAFHLCRNYGFKDLECECSESLAKTYESQGKLKRALTQYDQFVTLSREVHSQQNHRTLVEIAARVEIENADRERARMERIAIDASEKAEVLRQETERQNRELTQLALQLVQKNEFLCDLKEQIEPVAKSTSKAKAIAQRIDDHIRSDRDWETFEHQFNQVHREFLSRLSVKYPALTPTELRIAVMIKLNLPTKAVANLFCLSIRTVENHRQSIRRKLKLSSDDNLVSFLTGFDQV